MLAGVVPAVAARRSASRWRGSDEHLQRALRWSVGRARCVVALVFFLAMCSWASAGPSEAGASRTAGCVADVARPRLQELHVIPVVSQRGQYYGQAHVTERELGLWEAREWAGEAVEDGRERAWRRWLGYAPTRQYGSGLRPSSRLMHRVVSCRPCTFGLSVSRSLSCAIACRRYSGSSDPETRCSSASTSASSLCTAAEPP